MKKRFGLLVCLSLLTMMNGCSPSHTNQNSTNAPTSGTSVNQQKTQSVGTVANSNDSGTIRVMTIGGSIAHGWKDPSGSGYLHRTFETLTNQTSATYEVFDKTIPGANGTQLATMYKGRYEKWLKSVKPQIVVISWGLLNDAGPKTPLTKFKSYIHDEIELALSYHALVFMVTPPVTKATYTQFKTQQPMYVKGEISVAKKFDKSNVYVFNVFSQMKNYLALHHQTYLPYMGDGWHPNTAGHILASHLLVTDVLKKFGDRPITQR